MYHNTISWMMAGGLRDDHGEDVRQREHHIALREAAATRESRWFGLGDLRDLVTRSIPRATTSAHTDLACCVA